MTPSLASLAGFTVSSTMIVAVPGPGVLFIIGRSLSLGRQGGLLTVLGSELGAVLMVVAVAFGVGTIVATSNSVFTTVKLAGAAYLIYLAVQAVRGRHDGAAIHGELAGATTRRWQVTRQGLIVGGARR